MPEVALLDIGLPGMDGYELAAACAPTRARPALRLVALTGYGREPDRARALATHFDEHLVKPVTAERLFEVTDGCSTNGGYGGLTPGLSSRGYEGR